MYGMNGGLTYSEIRGMRRKEFTWMLERLRTQKERENAEIEKARNGLGQSSSRRKYVGA